MRLIYCVIFLFSIFLWSPSFASFPLSQGSTQVQETSLQTPTKNKKKSKLKVKNRFNNWLKSQSEWSVASLVCGICGLIAAGIPLGICAIIFGAIGYGKGKPGVATAGMILGFLDIALLLIFVL